VAIFVAISLLRQPPTADALFLEPAYDRLGGRLGVGLDMKVGGS